MKLKSLFSRRPREENARLNSPEWLRREFKLPSWARERPSSDKLAIRIEVDTARAYDEWRKLLGISEQQLDQYWLEVMYQCAKMDVQNALTLTRHDPRIAGKIAEIHFKRADDYALAKFPKGLGIQAASQGVKIIKTGQQSAASARSHYLRVRGRLPF